MKTEDRQAFRVFYQTFVKSATTAEQQELYTAMMGGKNARIEWLEKQLKVTSVPVEIVAIIKTMEFTKADIAYILAIKLAEEMAPVVADKTQSVIQTLISGLAKLLQPWTWGKKKSE